MDGSNWLLLNLNVSGYFRVNYNQENWDQLLLQLSSDHLVHGTGWAMGRGWAPTPRTPFQGYPATPALFSPRSSL